MFFGPFPNETLLWIFVFLLEPTSAVIFHTIDTKEAVNKKLPIITCPMPIKEYKASNYSKARPTMVGANLLVRPAKPVPPRAPAALSMPTEKAALWFTLRVLISAKLLRVTSL